MATEFKDLPQKKTWFRLPEYVKAVLEAGVDNTAGNLLALDADGSPVLVEKSTITPESSPGDAAEILSATVVITDINITPASVYNLVAAPGVGKLIMPISVISKVKITTGYTNGGGEELIITHDANLNLQTRSIGITDYTTIGNQAATGSVDAPFDALNINKPLDIVLSDNSTGSLLSGVGEITVTVKYGVVDFN
jgi:hypothetical protein